ncbi:sugar isomerase domain-containing protein [Cohnella sp. REN36]|uniref:sugar isomerase domain-containing protein n=1 Tax=Cohnella sp. REN36 TaxID=2887347 RepID=UPI001D13C981|nr:sugar isomerase domain-containing protein [Cohnella sp. REN36]MCC3375443.1 sugar isomerase domain-containing protein [Cohnella sp. REN36]
MLAERLLQFYKEHIDKLGASELPHIERFAEAVADRIAKGGALYLYDRGHLLSQELFHRAGGLALIRPLELPEKGTDIGRAENAVKESGLRSGDVLIIGSVSGKNAFVVELAIQAKKIGVTVAALTSLPFSALVESEHPGGQRLFEAADYVLDIHAAAGDAILEVPGLEEKMAPISGISAAVIGWCLKVQIADHLLKRGIKPTVYISVNLPGGSERFDTANQRVRELGY